MRSYLIVLPACVLLFEAAEKPGKAAKAKANTYRGAPKYTVSA